MWETVFLKFPMNRSSPVPYSCSMKLIFLSTTFYNADKLRGTDPGSQTPGKPDSPRLWVSALQRKSLAWLWHGWLALNHGHICCATSWQPQGQGTLPLGSLSNGSALVPYLDSSSAWSPGRISLELCLWFSKAKWTRDVLNWNFLWIFLSENFWPMLPVTTIGGGDNSVCASFILPSY